MFYEVSVSRISTATLTIRVQADSPESARGAALELAGDQDYSGCVVEYDFDANTVTEVKVENASDFANEIRPEYCDAADETTGEVLPETGEGTCALCPTVFPGVSDETIDAGWVPSYWIGEEEQEGPVCPNCAKQFLVTDPQYGESILCIKGEYTSVWDGGHEITSACTVDPYTRKIVIETTHDDKVDVLDREFVVLNGMQYPAANEEERGEFTPEEQSQMFFWC